MTWLYASWTLCRFFFSRVSSRLPLFRSSNTSNIFLQLVLQHCWIASRDQLAGSKWSVANLQNPAHIIGQLCVNKSGGYSTVSLSEESACRSPFGPFARWRWGKDSKKRNGNIYMWQWISQREQRGIFHQLIRELEVGGVMTYREFFRMMKKQFSFLLGKVYSLIQKKEQPPPINAGWSTIQPDEHLAVMLQYLAMGETIPMISFSWVII